MILILMILGGLIMAAIDSMMQIREQAAELEAQIAVPRDIRPTDLVRFGLFIREWIPQKGH